ncbi:MAG TPA: hypothetical protein VJ456_05035 [Acidimicrobiia bacterium]|nr:hypothetical protein [Acidimicrobiia bacterium]
MSERQWERAGSASGVGFVAAMIVSVFMVPAPPHINASTTEILDYVTSHRTALLSSALVGALAGVLFLVFLGHLRHVLQRSEGGVEALSPIVYGAGLTTVAVAFVCTLPLAALAFGTDSEVATNSGVVRLLWDLNALGTATMMIILSLFVAAVSLALIVREIRAPILGWLGLPIAAVLAVGGAAGFYNSSHEAFWYGLNYVALLSFAAFILGVSVQGLLSAAGETRVLRTPPQPIPST